MNKLRLKNDINLELNFKYKPSLEFKKRIKMSIEKK